MVALECERQVELLDSERHLRRVIVEPQQVELADNRLDAALEFAHTALVTRKVLDDVCNDILAEANLLEEIDLTQCSLDQIALRNDELLLDIEPADLDVVHTIAQNGIDALMIVVTEDEQTATEIEINAREILVLKAIILRTIRQMNQQIVDLLALGCLTDLVELIEVNDGIHALRLDEHIHNAAPC